MSSTPTTSANPSSSRVQSANTKGKDEPTVKTSRPPSASQKVENNSDPSSTALVVEQIKEIATELALSLGRPASASKITINDNSLTDSTNGEKKSSRPASANPKTDDSPTHGYTINVTNSRPSSAANRKAEESTVSAPVNSRPPSASVKTEQTSVHGYTISSTGSRPPSAVRKANESTVSDSTTTTTQNSRPSSASQTTDVTRLSDSSTPATASNSRPPSAAKRTDEKGANNPTTPRTGSRPPSATVKQNETATSDSTTEQSNKSDLFNSTNLNVTQPIIGRPQSGIKTAPANESQITASDENTEGPVLLIAGPDSADSPPPPTEGDDTTDSPPAVTTGDETTDSPPTVTTGDDTTETPLLLIAGDDTVDSSALETTNVPSSEESQSVET